MKAKNELVRIYVWHLPYHNSWVAEGKWWREDEYGRRDIIGTIGHKSFIHDNLTEAINEIIEVAKEMNIEIREDLTLDYSEKYSYWDEEEDGEPNPFPKPNNFDELIQKERERIHLN